jgi:hypothetical protein
MSDITTVEEVQAGDYTVRVAQTDDGSAWEAVVLSESGGSTNVGYGSKSGPGLMFTLPSVGSDDDTDDDAPLGPPVVAPHKWVAVGFAIEAYEWGQVNETPVDVNVGYKRSDEASEIDLLDAATMQTLNSHGTTFTGTWNPSGEDGESE